MGGRRTAGLCNRVSLVVLAALALGLTAAPSASALNGKIAFERVGNQFPPPPDLQIHTILPDGTGDAPITSGSPSSADPAWNPLGTKVAYHRGNSIYLANPDGSGAAPIFTWTDQVGAMSWSPDGDKLAVELRTCEADECRFDIYTIGTDGTGLFDVTPDLVEERNPSWSPDGTKIAFDSARAGNPDIYTIAPDGTGLTRLTTTAGATDPDWSPDGFRLVLVRGSEVQVYTSAGAFEHPVAPPIDGHSDSDPTWSPDGTAIAFVHPSTTWTCAGVPRAIWRASSSASASARTQVSQPPPVGQDCGSDLRPDWQQILGTYARPKGATPLRVPLVPAYRQCSTPNSSHGSPLAFGSCAPPVQESGHLTVGTSESNGLPSASVGFLLLKVHPGNPATTQDEADVGVDFSLTDVLRRDTLAAYTGQLRVELRLRITDGYNAVDLTSPPNEFATGDYRLTFDVPCSPATNGSTCQLHSSIDALTYSTGAVRELQRAIWELDQVRVLDGGANGQPGFGDEQVFAVQGLFAP